MTRPATHTSSQTVFAIRPLLTPLDVLFFFSILCIALAPVLLMQTYFSSFDTGFQQTLFLYGIALFSAVLGSAGIARIFLFANGYRRREKFFLESIADGVCAIDERGQIILWNATAEMMSGYSKKDVKRAMVTHCFALPHAHKADARGALLRILFSTPQPHEQSYLTLKTKTGRTLPITVAHAPLSDRNSAPRGAILVFHDISHEQQMDRAKDEIISLVSHQLRAPLTNMNWRLEMILDNEVGKLKEKQREYLLEVEQSSHRMTDLVNLFLNISRVRLNTLAIALQPCAVSTLLSEALQEYVQRMAQKNITLKKNISRSVRTFVCDLRIFQVILQNIIANAIEYTPRNGTIAIQVKKDGKELVFSVTDTGVGIPKKDQSKIFGKLFRAENVRTQYPNGNGLGLYLVKSLTEQAGGRIWFVSEEGKGATFFFSFPLSGMRKKRGLRSVVVTPRP